MHRTVDDWLNSPERAALVRQRAIDEAVERRMGSHPVFHDPLENLSREDVSELLPDLLRSRATLGNPTKFHPLVSAINSDHLSLLDVQQRAHLTTADFGQLMADSVSALLYTRFESLTLELNQVVRQMDVLNYRPVLTTEVGLQEPPQLEEESELKTIAAGLSETSAIGQLRSYGGKVGFSRALWSAWGDELTQQLLNYADIFSLIELRVLAETLESGTVPTSSGSSLTVATLTAAAHALRDQTNSAGQKANLGLHGLIVPPGQEMNARVVREDLGWPSLNILVNAYLTSDTDYYIVANPAVAPAILRQRLRGGGIPKVFNNSRSVEMDGGPRFAFEHSFNFVLSGLPGLVKVTAS